MASAMMWAAPKELVLEGNLAANYNAFEEHFKLLERTELANKSEMEKVSYFLLCAGERARELYRTFEFANAEFVTGETGEVWKRTLKEVKDKFRDHCNPKKNLTYERYVFNSRSQNESESINSYVTELRNLAANCEFGDLRDSLIRDRVVLGIRGQAMRERLLRVEDLTLEKAISMIRAAEISRQQTAYIKTAESPSEGSIEEITRKYKKLQTKFKKSQKQTESCKWCGLKHEPRKCPAFGKICSKCNRRNHFAKCCWRKDVQEVQESDDDSDVGEIDTIIIDGVEKTTETAKIQINGHILDIKIDSGAEANLLSEKDFKKVVPKFQQQAKLRPPKKRLTAYGGHTIPVLGKCFLRCRNTKGQEEILEYHVVKEHKSLLGCQSSKKLKFITFNVDGVCKGITEDPDALIGMTNQEILQGYKPIFEGIGCIAEPYHIKVREGAVPVVHAPRKIPASLREKVQDELSSMERKGIIKKVEEPTPWVNSMVVNEKKSGKLRICIDPRDLNKVIEREPYQLPTQQEITSRLAGARYFSKLDATSGYWQIPLDEESSYLTTFNSPMGRYRFQVVPFGIVFAQEVFHRTIDEKFRDLKGVETVIDDFLIWGKTLEEHDRNFKKCLDRIKEFGLTLNKEKCQFRLTEIEYLGEKLTQSGVLPDEKKISAILDYRTPQDKGDVQRLLGMINYVSKFTKNMSDITAPLRELIKKNAHFVWEEKHSNAFDNVKKALISPNILRFYDVTKEITLQVDASYGGLGATILQDEGPVAYASKAMNATQKKWAQIEKEMLAIVFGCSRFHQYVYGKKIKFETDHKPLEVILNKPLSQAPTRLQKMMMQLQAYDIAVIYKKGKEMHVADALSRAYSEEIVEEQFDRDIEQEKCIHLMSKKAYITDRRLQEIAKENKVDNSIQKLIGQIKLGWPERREDVAPEIRCYYDYRFELLEEDGLVYKGHRILVPSSLRKDILQKLHISHQGIVKTKQIARDTVFWPGLAQQIESMIQKCDPCQQLKNSNQKEPLQPHELPERPWQKVGTDLFQWNKKDYLIVADYYSRYFEVCELRSTSSPAVINKTKSFFARHGIPEIVVSDNGPQFIAEDYKNFAASYGFYHDPSSPRYPQSNGSLKSVFKKFNCLNYCHNIDKQKLRSSVHCGEGSLEMNRGDGSY